MNTDEFWKLIETARSGDADCSGVCQRVRELLEELPPEEIFGFYRELQQRRAESYRWDLWAVGYIVNGGCSDDGFEYFRCWLISQGRGYFEAALHDPRRAADRAEFDENECEELMYVAYEPYKKRTGDVLPPVIDVQFPKNPTGTPWEEDKLKDLYPDLCERFS